jgi:predicted NUDIX family phosphoesterase
MSNENVPEEVVAVKAPKMALCIYATDMFKPFSQWETFLMDRAIVDDPEKLNPNILQVLPYITLVNEDGEIFTYERGNKGAETRLYGLRSLGLGGHIEMGPNDTNLTDLESIIAAESMRELNEEVGLAVTAENLDKLHAAIKDGLVLYCADTPVDSVHIAISLLVQVNSSELTKLEDGQIINPKWMSAAGLSQVASLQQYIRRESMVWALETWSQRVAMIQSTEESFQLYKNIRLALENRFSYQNKIAKFIQASIGELFKEVIVSSKNNFDVYVKKLDNALIKIKLPDEFELKDDSSIKFQENTSLYLLTNTKDTSIISSWRSLDLITWTFEGEKTY